MRKTAEPDPSPAIRPLERPRGRCRAISAPHVFRPPRFRKNSVNSPKSKENPMKTYQGSEIRNVAVVGHAHCGKTTLIAALLHAAKMTPTQGRVEDGSAATAYDEEEVARGITMQNAVAFAEWQGTKINLVDTPGFHMFTHEARAALFPVESALVGRQRPERRRARHRACVALRRRGQSSPHRPGQPDGQPQGRRRRRPERPH